jgi:hypothetical protein
VLISRWKFQHDQLQDCINARIAEVTADLKKKNPAATTATTTTTTNPAVATQAINAQEERTRKEVGLKYFVLIFSYE